MAIGLPTMFDLPDDDDLGPVDLDAGTDQELLDPGRCAGEVIGLADHHLPHIHRMKAVDILFRIDRVEDLGLVDVLRQRKLNEDAVDFGIPVVPVDQGQESILRIVSGWFSWIE